MARLHQSLICFIILCLSLSACGGRAKLDVAEGMGPAPTLPPPEKALIPVIKISPAAGWPPGATPVAAPGLRVAAFATGLDHPRWMTLLPNGDVLVGCRILLNVANPLVEGIRRGISDILHQPIVTPVFRTEHAQFAIR